MAKHVYLLVPEQLKIDDLPKEAQAAIAKVFGNYVMPMPLSQALDGLVICDAQTEDSFDPAVMKDYGLDWEIIGLEQWDDKSEETKIIIPLNVEAFEQRLVPVPLFDKDGALTGTEPRPLSQVNFWDGWPASKLFKELS